MPNQSKILQKKIECAIDENIVDCESDAFKQDAINYYTGVPAPAYLSDDDWFGGAPTPDRKANGLYGTGNRN